MTNLRQNLLHGRGPDERLRVIVVRGNEFVDGRTQSRNALEGATANALVGELAKPAFDEIQPRRGGWGEVQVKARMLGQPVLHLGMLVRPVVVQNHMDAQLSRDALIDLAQELAELDVAMPREAGTDHRALDGVQSGKQRRGAIALVVMRHRSTPPILERQARLRTVQRLDLRLLVDA